MSTLEAIAWCCTAIAIVLVAAVIAAMKAVAADHKAARAPEDDEGLDFLGRS